MRQLRFHGVTIEHPGARARESGETSQAFLQLINARDSFERVPLDEMQLVRLLADASKVLAILKDPRR